MLVVPISDFLSAMDVVRRIPDPAEEDVQSEMSEGELREREEKAEERRRRAERMQEAGELGDELSPGVNEDRSEAESEEECTIHILGVGQGGG